MTDEASDPVPVPELPECCPEPRRRYVVPRCRRFNLGDGMIVTAALAVWLGSLRWLSPGHRTSEGLLFAFLWSMPVLLLAFTAAYLGFRIRTPRPPRRELLRQPGMLGGLSALASLVVAVVLNTWWSPLAVPGTVLGTWVVMASRGGLRPEGGWIDRLGRTLAAGWCLVGLLFSFAGYLIRGIPGF